MANETNPGYLVQLQSPEGDNVYPVVTPDGIVNKDGSKFNVNEMLSDIKSEVADVGNLHVWRRTSTTSSEVPAGYALADPIENIAAVNLGRLNNNVAHFGFAKTINVYDNGYVSLDAIQYWIWYYEYSSVMQTVSAAYFMSASGSSSINLTPGEIPGNFVYFYGSSTSWYDESIDINQWYYVPKDAVVTVPSNKSDDTWVIFSKLQKVVSYPKTAAGSSTTYVTSKNSNAHTSGNNSIPAYYTLGAVVSGMTALALNYNSRALVYTTNKPIVNDDGTVSSVIGGRQISYTEFDTYRSEIPGTFAYSIGSSADTTIPEYIRNGGVIYIPSDATLQRTTVNGYSGIYTDKYQQVVGHATVPASITTEYMGMLGDGTRIQHMTYIGTGTYGSSNPNKLTFDFVPKIVFIIGSMNNGGDYFGNLIMIRDHEYASFAPYTGNNKYCDVTWNDTEISWYTPSSDVTYQMNGKNATYSVVAFG